MSAPHLSWLSRAAAALEDGAALADAYAERHERAGRNHDAAEERPTLVALVRLHGGLVRISRNGSNSPRGREPIGRCPGSLSQTGHGLALDDGVSVPAFAVLR